MVVFWRSKKYTNHYWKDIMHYPIKPQFPFQSRIIVINWNESFYVLIFIWEILLIFFIRMRKNIVVSLIIEWYFVLHYHKGNRYNIYKLMLKILILFSLFILSKFYLFSLIFLINLNYLEQIYFFIHVCVLRSIFCSND